MTCLSNMYDMFVFNPTVDYRKAIATRLWIMIVVHFPKELYTRGGNSLYKRGTDDRLVNKLRYPGIWKNQLEY